ncbi:MAG: class I SAM-dependent methyltransferase [Chromatiales bacterium]|nr:class I SAM-dependent methyltransferase [Chromatiales bacterium]
MLDAAEENQSLFHQIQAYDGLMRLLKPIAPLPLLRGWAASPDYLLLITGHVLKQKPIKILECSSGTTTIVLARCCQLNGGGHVYSLEHNQQFAIQTREWLAEQQLTEWATVIDAPLIPTGESGQPWYDLSRLQQFNKSFEMLVVDGPPSNLSKLARYPALPQLDRILDEKAIVFLDDAKRGDEKLMLERWRNEFPQYSQKLLNLEKGTAVLTKLSI